MVEDSFFDDEDGESKLQKLKKKIVKARGALDDEVLEWLDAKFTKHNMGLEEQFKYLKRHVYPNFTYDFDFEACPFGKHREFMACYKEEGCRR